MQTEIKAMNPKFLEAEADICLPPENGRAMHTEALWRHLEEPPQAPPYAESRHGAC